MDIPTKSPERTESIPVAMWFTEMLEAARLSAQTVAGVGTDAPADVPASGVALSNEDEAMQNAALPGGPDEVDHRANPGS